MPIIIRFALYLHIFLKLYTLNNIKQLWFPLLCVIACFWFYSFCLRSMTYSLCLSSSLTFRTLSRLISLLCLALLYLFWSGLDATPVSFYHNRYMDISYFSVRTKVPQDSCYPASMSIALMPSMCLALSWCATELFLLLTLMLQKCKWQKALKHHDWVTAHGKKLARITLSKGPPVST